MENNVIPKEIIERAQKLLNLKEGAEAIGSHAESANAAARLTALLLKHNLDLQSVKEAGVKAKATITEELYDLNDKQSKTEANWVVKLFNVVALHNMCQCIHHLASEGQGAISVLGSKLNVQMVYFIVDQLISKIRIAEKMSWKQYLAGYAYEKRNTFKRGFFMGAVAAIAERLMKIEEEVVKQAMSSSPVEHYAAPENMALMLISNKEELDKYAIEKYPDVFTKKRKVSYQGNHGMHMGYNAGKNMEINQGIEGSKVSGHLN